MSSREEYQQKCEVQLASDFYAVEAILKKKVMDRNGKLIPHYLVRWVGYPKVEDHTWEPYENLVSVRQLVKSFQSQQQAKRITESRKEQPTWRQSSQKSQNSKAMLRAQTDQRILSKQSRGSDHDNNQLKHLKKISFSQNSLESPRKLTEYIAESSAKKSNLERINISTGQFYDNAKSKDIQRQHEKQQKKKAERQRHFQQKRQQKRLAQTKQKIIVSNQQKNLVKNAVVYGKILNHVYNNGVLVYQVEINNSQGKHIRNQMMTSHKVQDNCPKALNTYLQNLLIELQQVNKSKRS